MGNPLIIDGKIRLKSGGYLDLQNPQVDQINYLDIAEGLGCCCRFSGQPGFISVAQHSIRVANLAPPDLRKVALLHDATEAYLGDMVKSLKVLLPGFVEIEKNLERIIFEKFDLDVRQISQIKAYDHESLLEEHRFFDGEEPFERWDPATATIHFRSEMLRTFHTKYLVP